MVAVDNAMSSRKSEQVTVSRKKPKRLQRKGLERWAGSQRLGIAEKGSLSGVEGEQRLESRST